MNETKRVVEQRLATWAGLCVLALALLASVTPLWAQTPTATPNQTATPIHTPIATPNQTTTATQRPTAIPIHTATPTSAPSAWYTKLKIGDWIDIGGAALGCIVSLVIFFLGLLWPWIQSFQRRMTFTDLIRREFSEMNPRTLMQECEPSRERTDPQSYCLQRGLRWYKHLDRRFIHEHIFENITGNRDFILSLPPELAYHITQMWVHFEKAQREGVRPERSKHSRKWIRPQRETQSRKVDLERLDHGREWEYHLGKACEHLNCLERQLLRRIYRIFREKSKTTQDICNVYARWAWLIREYKNAEEARTKLPIRVCCPLPSNDDPDPVNCK